MARRRTPPPTLLSTVCCVAADSMRALDALFDKKRMVFRVLDQAALEANTPTGVETEVAVDPTGVLWVYTNGQWVGTMPCVSLPPLFASVEFMVVPSGSGPFLTVSCQLRDATLDFNNAANYYRPVGYYTYQSGEENAVSINFSQWYTTTMYATNTSPVIDKLDNYTFPAVTSFLLTENNPYTIWIGASAQYNGASPVELYVGRVKLGTSLSGSDLLDFDPSNASNLSTFNRQLISGGSAALAAAPVTPPSGDTTGNNSIRIYSGTQGSYAYLLKDFDRF